ncbi:MAG: hypothetical protein KBF88_16605, partial [Polyangiaceae bacterium]|nr:hypothetical protein [Polyangiaceae bacterium]
WRASYLARCILDEVMGRDAFLNEVVWKRAPNLGRQAQSFQFGRTLDTLIVYGGPKARLQPPTRLEVIDPKAIRWDEEKRPFTAAPRGDYTDESIERLDAEGRVHRSKTGKVYIKYFLIKNDHNEWCRERRVDTLWTDVAPIRHSKNDERTGYPTQKPVALLERVLLSASEPGDLVLDVFGGSGTTAVAAQKLGRVAVVGDEQSLAISMMRSRLLREGAAFRIERLDASDAKRAEPEVECTFEARSTFVRLLAPKEPMAWAVQVPKGEAGPLFAQDVHFETVWHSERGARTTPTPVDLDAKIRRASRIRVLVFEDDGTVLEKIVDDARASETTDAAARKGKAH